MLRSAAKNFARVAVATDPAQYAGIVDELDGNDGTLSAQTRFALVGRRLQPRRPVRRLHQRLAVGDPATTARRALFPAQQNSNFVKVMDLRYGENPHQHGAFYRDLYPVPGTLATFTQLQGKELSYNNLADADAAWECVRQFEQPGLRDRQARQSLRRGRRRRPAATPTSAPTPPIRPRPSAASSPSTARSMRRTAEDHPRAPVRRSADRAAITTTARSPTREEGQRARAAHPARRRHATTSTSSASARGLLMQTSDIREVTPRRTARSSPSSRRPTAQLDDLLFAWRVAKYVKSNAIVYAKDQPHHRHRRRPDEPRGVGEDRRRSRPRKPGLTCPAR